MHGVGPLSRSSRTPTTRSVNVRVCRLQVEYVSPCHSWLVLRTSEAPARRAAWLDGPDGGRGARHQPVDVPRWRAGRRRAVPGGDRLAGVVRSRRPTVGGPPLRQVSDGRRISDLLGRPVHHKVELVGGDAQHAPRVAVEVASLTAAFTGLEPERAVDPQRADACDVRLPSGLIVVSQQVCRSGPRVPGACERPDRGVRRQPTSPSAEVGRDRPGSGIHNLVTVGTLQRHGQGFSQRRAGARPGRDHRWFASHTNDGYG